MEGYRQWNDYGLQVPDKVLKTTKSFRDESDVVGQWLDSCCITTNNYATTPVKDLHSSYRKWCENSGHEALPANMFGKELTRKGFTDKRSNKGNKKIGISLIPSPDDDLIMDYPFASFFDTSKEKA